MQVEILSICLPTKQMPCIWSLSETAYHIWLWHDWDWTQTRFISDDFAGISSFNSQEVLNAVGIATSDIAEMALLPVSRTISTPSKENRIIDEQGQSEYNKDIKDERSQSDERNHIHDGGRLQSSEPEAAGADGSDSRQMVADEENLSEGTSQILYYNLLTKGILNSHLAEVQ